MAQIVQEFTVRAPAERVFQTMGTPEGLAHWWTESSSGQPQEGAEFALTFNPEHDWKGRVRRYLPNSAFEIEITHAHPDWIGTRVGCELLPEGANATRVRFYHTGWPTENQHWRVSCYCWAMYLRTMRRYLEHGESIPYKDRLDA